MLDRTRNFPNPSHHAMHVPRTMFAAAIDRFGGPEVITAHALPVPEVDAGEVLIAVEYRRRRPMGRRCPGRIFCVPQAAFSTGSRL
jgi:hypothetical protein